MFNLCCLTWKISAVNPLIAAYTPLYALTLQGGKGQVKTLLWSYKTLLKFDLTLKQLANAEGKQYGNSINKMSTCIYYNKEQSTHELRGWNILEVAKHSSKYSAEQSMDFLNCFHNVSGLAHACQVCLTSLTTTSLKLTSDSLSLHDIGKVVWCNVVTNDKVTWQNKKWQLQWVYGDIHSGVKKDGKQNKKYTVRGWISSQDVHIFYSCWEEQ